MQHIDDNMDELFRKAASDYPLKINTGRWDDIVPLVDLVPPVAIAIKKRRSPFAIIAVLVFSIGGILIATNRLFNVHGNQQQLLVAKKITQTLPNQPATKFNNTVVAVPKIAVVIATTNAVEYKHTIEFIKKTNNTPGEWESVNDNSAAMRPAFPRLIPERMDAAFIHTSLPIKEVNMRVTLPKDAAAVSPRKTVAKASRFYFGLEAGVQWNEVKGQGFNKAGLSAGVLAGLQLNKNLSVETGIAWSQKHFFTDGKYFNMSKAVSSMPSNMQVMSMSSCSNLLEIPVKFNYTIIHKKSSNWFLAAGISSYILTKESNHYLAVINGQEQNAAGEYIAKRNYFSAVAQLGVGYQYKASKQIKLRIEPYLQIPLKGIGIGEVQVMTAGLHLALLRSTRN